jgi:hypothetical protein
MSGERYLHPAWGLMLPLTALTAYIVSPPERQMAAALLSSTVTALVPWVLPEARLRLRHYLGPVNLALSLLMVKLAVVPALLMLLGDDNRILALTASNADMQGALLIDVVAYVAFCVGLQWVRAREVRPREDEPRPQLSGVFSSTPGGGVAWVYVALGLVGLALEFGSPARLWEYFTQNPPPPRGPATVAQFLGTLLRPFLAFGLAAWWARAADRSRLTGRWWRPAAVGAVAVVGITAANMTFSFNRAAFVFPVLALLAVFALRVRHIPFGVTAALLAATAPLLLAVGTYRSSVRQGLAPPPPARDWRESAREVAANINAYAGGPQLTGVFYRSIGWGERLYGGTTLLASVMSPVPVLGKGFRDTNGPAVYNRALYGVPDIEDQIPPAAAELFANLHIGGVLAGFVLLGMLVGKSQPWLAAAGSTFGVFIIQYVAMWTAMLTVWSISVYAQILVYFLGPVYAYAGAKLVRQWLRGPAGRAFPRVDEVRP